MFNSPIDWCPECKQWLALDEECPGGPAKSDCPLAAARAATASLMRRLDHPASLPSRKYASSNSNTTFPSGRVSRSSFPS
ncbi:MAG: hypothetical protein K0R40_968 [Burkholderiales bacterium]|nr:hypothetical protein [Burkholderiales bacterium]